jgi:class 3 adenylate cyclase
MSLFAGAATSSQAQQARAFTLLFTDIQGSTRLYPEGMQHTLTRHDALLRSAIERHGGHVCSRRWATLLVPPWSNTNAALTPICPIHGAGEREAVLPLSPNDTNGNPTKAPF